jgi:hypothetical protein
MVQAAYFNRRVALRALVERCTTPGRHREVRANMEKLQQNPRIAQYYFLWEAGRDDYNCALTKRITRRMERHTERRGTGVTHGEHGELAVVVQEGLLLHQLLVLADAAAEKVADAGVARQHQPAHLRTRKRRHVAICCQTLGLILSR